MEWRLLELNASIFLQDVFSFVLLVLLIFFLPLELFIVSMNAAESLLAILSYWRVAENYLMPLKMGKKLVIIEFLHPGVDLNAQPFS